MRIETHYAKSGDVNIAYQVAGDGPRDLVVVPGWISNIDLFWDEPHVAQFFERLASFSRLILFDKRGTGLSDRVLAWAPGSPAARGGHRCQRSCSRSLDRRWG